MKVLYVNPIQKQCGIYQFGKKVADILATSNKYEFKYIEAGTMEAFLPSFEEFNPDITLYSSNETTMRYVYYSNIKDFPGIHVGMSHEPEQCMLDSYSSSYGRDFFNGSVFDYWIGHDPTLNLSNSKKCFKACRPIVRSPYTAPPQKFTIGCQCFGFPHRGHALVVEALNNELDEAIIRFNMAPAFYGDQNLAYANATAERCREKITKEGIQLEITNEFFETEEELTAFCAGNTANAYFYQQAPVPGYMRGVASSPDVSIQAHRPVVVSSCGMFRHLHPIFGSYPEDGTFMQIVDRAYRNKAAEFAYDEWSPDRMIADYLYMFERIL